METPFSKEYISSLLAHVTGSWGLKWMERFFTDKAEEKIAQVNDRVKKAKEERAELEKLRIGYAGHVARMQEPFRTALNNQYRIARSGRLGISEEIFMKLITKKLALEETWERKVSYLEYFAKLRRHPRPDPHESGVLLPSIEEELDKFYEGSLKDERRKWILGRLELRRAARELKKRRKERVPKPRWSFFQAFNVLQLFR